MEKKFKKRKGRRRKRRQDRKVKERKEGERKIKITESVVSLPVIRHKQETIFKY